MTTAVKKAKYIRLMEAMVNGRSFTEKQIEATYKVASARSALFNIRKLGVTVNCTKKNGVARYSISNSL